MGKDNIIGRSLIMGAVEGLIMSGIESAGKAIKEGGAEVIKRHIFNIGTTDEMLYLKAEQYALENGSSEDELAKFTRAMDSLEKSQRNRVRGMIGDHETDKENVDGGKILVRLSKMSEAEIVAKLKSSGASGSFIHELKETASKTTVVVKNSEFVKDSENFFGKETWLEKKLREEKTRRGLI